MRAGCVCVGSAKDSNAAYAALRESENTYKWDVKKEKEKETETEKR